MKQFSSIKLTKIEFQWKVENAKIISVSSIFDFNTEKFFAQEMLKANTLIITKDSGKLSFVKQNDSEFWEEGFEYELDIKVGRIFRLFGKHFIKVIKIDHQNIFPLYFYQNK